MHMNIFYDKTLRHINHFQHKDGGMAFTNILKL